MLLPLPLLGDLSASCLSAADLPLPLPAASTSLSCKSNYDCISLGLQQAYIPSGSPPIYMVPSL